jgi:GH25 family lysozyme M1 (1,4-beta-N-acetylmuramidase)
LSVENSTNEVDLVGEPSRGDYGTFDVDNFGPPALRVVKEKFVFPDDVDEQLAYGIDISHYTKEVPWTQLSACKVNYVYIKASQSSNGRDGKFVSFWQGAATSGLPYGAYHFVTAGISGTEQAKYFMKRLNEVGGLKKGHLQPVIDLEWDEWGSEFKRVAVGRSPQGETLYKDYWDDVTKEQIAKTVNDCLNGLRAAAGNLALKPIVYTNRSWWDSHIPPHSHFDCTVWISDYRDKSYASNSPRSVQGHDYHLWQFTAGAKIKSGNATYGPYDSNKLVFGAIDKVTIL